MIGCTSQTLLDWVKRDEIDNGERVGVTGAERECLKALERAARPSPEVMRVSIDRSR
jgi:transposase